MKTEIGAVYASYPDSYRERLLHIRDLILSLKSELEEMERIEESLKWGEPAYSTLGGSTVRLAWSQKRPNEYGVYFPCQSVLVETFRKIYPTQFNYRDNRAIAFEPMDEVDEEALKTCLFLALTYHKRKHFPLLGVEKSEKDLL